MPFEANLRSSRCATAPTSGSPTPGADPGTRARTAARVRAALGDRGEVEDGDPLVVRVRPGVADDRLAEALRRAGLVLTPEGRVCTADPGQAVEVRLQREE